MSATDPVQAVTEALMTHMPRAGQGHCRCGHPMPTPQDYATHRSEAAVEAARPAIFREVADLIDESSEVDWEWAGYIPLDFAWKGYALQDQGDPRSAGGLSIPDWFRAYAERIEGKG